MPTEEEIKAAEEAKVKADADAAKAAEDEAKKKEADNADFDTWLAKQPKDVQDRFVNHTTGLKSALEKERLQSKELTKAQKKLKELEEAEAKRAEAELSEKDKLEKRALEAEAKREQAEKDLRESRIRTVVEREAVRLQFNDPEDVFKHVDLSQFEIGDDGKIKGVKEAVEALAKSKDYLLRKETTKSNGSPRSKGRQVTQESNTPQAAIPRL